MQANVPTTNETHEPRYEPANDRYVLEYDPDGSATLPTTVVHAIATIADVDVSQGEFSLYDSVDPDALERIFAAKTDGTRRAGGHVAFTALEHEVYVHADGSIHIYPPAQTSGKPRPRPTR